MTGPPLKRLSLLLFRVVWQIEAIDISQHVKGHTQIVPWQGAGKPLVYVARQRFIKFDVVSFLNFSYERIGRYV